MNRELLIGWLLDWKKGAPSRQHSSKFHLANANTWVRNPDFLSFSINETVPDFNYRKWQTSQRRGLPFWNTIETSSCTKRWTQSPSSHHVVTWYPHRWETQGAEAGSGARGCRMTTLGRTGVAAPAGRAEAPLLPLHPECPARQAWSQHRRWGHSMADLPALEKRNWSKDLSSLLILQRILRDDFVLQYSLSSHS